MDTLDPPCDFDVFVAQSRGISREQAQRLIQSWLTHYCPREAPFRAESGNSDTKVQFQNPRIAAT
jgi:hypothetical protein